MRVTRIGFPVCPRHGIAMRLCEGRELREGAPTLQWWACPDGCLTAEIPKPPALSRR